MVRDENQCLFITYAYALASDDEIFDLFNVQALFTWSVVVKPLPLLFTMNHVPTV